MVNTKNGIHRTVILDNRFLDSDLISTTWMQSVRGTINCAKPLILTIISLKYVIKWNKQNISFREKIKTLRPVQMFLFQGYATP